MTVALPSWLANSNWFFLTIPIPYSFWFFSRRQRKFLNWYLIGTSILLSLGIGLELYYRRGCKNSPIFHQLTQQIAIDTYQSLSELNIKYWLMFGNTLFALRGQTTIPRSDTDSDVGILQLSLPDRKKLIQHLESRFSYHVRYEAERNLIQAFAFDSYWGPHSDIWEYTTTEGELVNDDYTIRGGHFPYEKVFPLQYTSFLGENVSYPSDPHYMSRLEYGDSYLTPLTARSECMENILNGFCFFQNRVNQLWTVVLLMIQAFGIYQLLKRLQIALQQHRRLIKV